MPLVGFFPPEAKKIAGLPHSRGAWGGGNQFAKSVVRVLEGGGHKVVYSLDEEDDIILLTETRGVSFSCLYCGKGYSLHYF